MKTESGRSLLVALMTLLAPISWGSTYIVVTELLPAGHPLLIAAARVLPAGLLLAAFGLVASGWRPHGREWRHITILAIFNFALFMPLLAAATYRLPGGVVGSLGGLQPLLVLTITWLMRGERPTSMGIGVGIAGAIGVALVVSVPVRPLDPIGLALALGANLSFAIGVVLTKTFPAPRKRLAATGWQLLISAVVIVPLAAVLEGAPPRTTELNLIGFAYLSLVATGLAAVLWFDGIEKLPSGAPPLLGLGSAITSVALGWLILGQSLTTLQLVGFAITIGAIAYGALGGRPRHGRDEERPRLTGSIARGRHASDRASTISAMAASQRHSAGMTVRSQAGDAP